MQGIADSWEAAGFQGSAGRQEDKEEEAQGRGQEVQGTSRNQAPDTEKTSVSMPNPKWGERSLPQLGLDFQKRLQEQEQSLLGSV